MLARCPGLFIQAVITAWASAWPRAMFSPPRLLMPSFLARSHGVWPSGSVWSKKSRAAMSSLNACARPSSLEFSVRATQPALARSVLTRDSTAARTAALLSLGALCVGVAARVGGVVLTGVVGAVVVRVGLGAVTGLVAVAGGAVMTGDAEVLGRVDGLWPVPVCPGVGVPLLLSGDGESLPSVVGAVVPSAWVRSPLLSYVIPPGTP